MRVLQARAALSKPLSCLFSKVVEWFSSRRYQRGRQNQRPKASDFLKWKASPEDVEALSSDLGIEVEKMNF